ncbi:MAG: UDP-N-acetylmuramoyl-L-alanine--D-glutamate ligase [Myxococcales bacterium]|nr:UDP-N-acetylmuramoyl-L-alanine--D-glutamate ligase [Myxococcales bacterium]USN51299.1 MAG: UDP-N-acetylmuramoyl-L-alanine--D-glutamate ligase [Myxococcales bacterium]
MIKHALIIGAGLSGLAAARLLLKRGIKVSLFDDKPESKLRFFQNFSYKCHENLRCHFNDSQFSFSPCIDAVVLSPGVSLHHPLIAQAKERSIPILNEIEIALRFKAGTKIIGITGSNGKSTTTMMLDSILKSAGLKSVAGGNIGIPLCTLVLDSNFDYLILELSSFQLETLKQIQLDCAIILNITPNHLDRYDSFDCYQKAKFKIFDLVKAQGHIYCNNTLLSSIDSKAYPTKHFHFFNAQKIDKTWNFLKELSLNGMHNVENALAAAYAAKTYNISNESIVLGLNYFKPLEFRFQNIGTKRGINFINDSKATTVAAVEKALSCTTSPVHLLVGGHDKGENFAPLTAYSQVVAFYVYGSSQEKIALELADLRSQQFKDLDQAFCAAVAQAKPGTTVLLSPGCASYDQFEDYVDRGKHFKRLVDNL